MDAALGGDPSSVRAARADERQAVTAAVAAAGRHLEGSGHPATEAGRRRMEATLRAAMVDDSVAERLGHGVLDADQDAPGFGFDGPAGPVAGKGVAAVEPGPDPAADEAARQAAELRARLTEEADRLASRAEDLEAIAREAEAVALQARQAADEATQQATEARVRAEEAD
jgi:hypothetical protein